MWNYTKCTARDRKEKLKDLAEAFRQEADCLKYLWDVQNDITGIQTTMILLQDLEANIMIEMDYVPVNNYAFHVIRIEESGIMIQGRKCRTIGQAIDQFIVYVEGLKEDRNKINPH